MTAPRLVPAEFGHKCRCGEDAISYDTLTGRDECKDHLPIEELPGGRENAGVRIFLHPSEIRPDGRVRR